MTRRSGRRPARRMRSFLPVLEPAERSPTVKKPSTANRRGAKVNEINAPPNDSRAFVHKRFLGAAGGFLGGGVIGAFRGFTAPSRGAGPSLPPPSNVPRPRAFEGRAPRRGVPVVGVPGLRGVLERFIPTGATGLQVADATGGGCPQGFHPNKSDYMTKGGFVAEGSKCVKNRRRNLSNGRANKRALRRINAWDKQDRQLGKTLKAIVRGR